MTLLLDMLVIRASKFTSLRSIRSLGTVIIPSAAYLDKVEVVNFVC